MAILTTTNQGLNFIGGTTFIQTGTSTVMSLQTNGNVGIGTTSPDYKFEVQGVISSADAGLQKATFANVGNDLVLTANADATNVTANILFNSSGAGGSSVSTKMTIDGVGAIRFNKYNGADRAGTPTYLLGTDLQGNVVKTLGGAPSAGGGTTSQSKYYTSLTGSSTDFFPLFTINDVMGPVNCKIFTYAHDSLEFSVAEGYGPSNAGSITIINSVQTANGNYATVEAVRIDQAGVVEVKLTWGVATPTVSIGVLITGYQVPNLVASLATGTSTATTVDSVDVNTTGILRSKNKLQVGGTYLNASANTISLNRTGNSYIVGNTADNFGIGTSGPTYKLDVVGNGRFSGFLEMATGGAVYQGQKFYLDGGGDTFLESPSSNIMTFTTNGDEKMRILSSGRIGVGTTTPDAQFEIVQSAAAASAGEPTLMVANAPAGNDGLTFQSWRYVQNNSNFRLDLKQRVATGIVKYAFDMVNNGSGFSNVLAFDRGNIGIGTENPGAQLEVMKDGGAIIRLHDPGNNSWKLKADTDFHIYDDSNVDYFKIVNSGAIVMSGKVGIGITTNTTIPLHVNQGSVSGTVIKASGIGAIIEIQASSAGNATLYQRPNVTGDKEAEFRMTLGSTYGWSWIDDNSNAGSRIKYMKLQQSNGTLTVKGDIVAFGAPSDRRYKDNIKPIESALDKAMKLEGVTFDWKESDSILDIKEDIGFIAQDVQKVVPELVRENKDGKLSLRYQGITPILLEAIKELKAEIEELKKKIK